MDFTNEQLKAIETRGSNLLVAAAAGAGKTAVLVERIIRMILDEKNPVDIDKLLVVTFTNAAASEMRERIADAISKRLDENPDSKNLQRQIALLGKADIITIHAFCLAVIRNNFHIHDIDPSFRIADETESLLLKQEVMDSLFDLKYEEGDEGFLELVDSYSEGRDDGKLKNIVMRLYEFSMSTPYPEKWLYNACESFNIGEEFDFNKLKLSKILQESIKIELEGIYTRLSRLLDDLEEVSELEAYKSNISKEAILIKEAINQDEWSTLKGAVENIVFDRLPSLRNISDKAFLKYVQDIRNDCKKSIKAIKDSLEDDVTIVNEFKGLYTPMKKLCDLTIAFISEFKEKKKGKNIIDFSDIEHFCINILIDIDDEGNILPSDVALSLRKKYEEILIDEYQDSNMVQELILKMISRKEPDNPNMFMVGDIKQSIYRFRQAKPELFLEKYNSYKDSGNNIRVLLYKNFRSRSCVIDSVNYIFKAIMSKNIGEMEYGDEERLNAGAEFEPIENDKQVAGGNTELYIIENKVNDEEDKESSKEDTNDDEDSTQYEDVDKVSLEAKMVAGRIKDLINARDKTFVVYDNTQKRYRKVEYKDIVILMRATKAYAPVFMEELSYEGIPVYADTDSGYFDVVEVKTVLSLLEIIDNPRQDIPLIAVLRSPIGNFCPEDLIQIRLTDKKVSFYEALNKKAALNDGEVSCKADCFLKKLSKWRKKSKYMQVSELIWYLYDATGYFAYAGAILGGVQRQANLRILFERAKQFENTSYTGLFNFVNFINKLRNSSSDLGSARTLSENDNVVRIMSIHKSKGLEFPVVFITGLGKKFNLMDIKESILFHHELGLGPDLVHSKRRIITSTIVKRALKRKILLENYSEEMRILYVAMTRAKEKLILTGTVNDLEKALSRWKESLNFPGNKVLEYQILKGNTFLDFICPALLKHNDLKDFRNYSEEDNNILLSALVEDPSKWEVKIVKREEILKKQEENTDLNNEQKLFDNIFNSMDEKTAPNSEHSEDYKRLYEEICRRLDYEYEYKHSSKIPSKISVTELKRLINDEDLDEEQLFKPTIIKKPKFLNEEKRITATERGTITHLIMQHIDLSKNIDASYLNSLLESLLELKFITMEQKKSIYIKNIISFFESSLGKRLLKSKNVRREVPFYTKLSSFVIDNTLDKDIYKDEYVILQGIIDCYFEEDEKLILVDYKTDYFEDDEIDKVALKYKAQLDYYAMALEKLTNKKVSEKYIYFLNKSRTYGI